MLASRAAVAVCCTVPVSCSMELAVFCRWLAVFSVRIDRSVLPLAISREAESTWTALLRTWRIDCSMRCRASISRAVVGSLAGARWATARSMWPLWSSSISVISTRCSAVRKSARARCASRIRMPVSATTNSACSITVPRLGSVKHTGPQPHCCM